MIPPRPRHQNRHDKLSLFDVAAALQMPIDDVRRAIFKGELRAVRIGGKRRVRRDALAAFMAKRAVAQELAPIE